MQSFDIKRIDEDRVPTLDWADCPLAINIESKGGLYSLIVCSIVIMGGLVLLLSEEQEMRILGLVLILFCLLPLPVFAYMKWRRNQPPATLMIYPADPKPGHPLQIRYEVPDAKRARKLELIFAWDDQVPFDFDVGTGNDRRLTRDLLSTTDRQEIAGMAFEILAPTEDDLDATSERERFGYSWKIFFCVDYDGLRSHRSHATISSVIEPQE